MAEASFSSSARSGLKRRLSDDDDESARRPVEKRARFPKGKKVKKGEERPAEELGDDGVPTGVMNPRLAAMDRAMRRRQLNDGGGFLEDVTAAEMNYENGGNFEDDGIVMEPFNLKQEREEGYFDADGNYVEYLGKKQIKDAWLDSVDSDVKHTPRNVGQANKEVEVQELSSNDIGQIIRRIADILEPGETVLQALRRLKGNTSGKKEKMPEQTKRTFDQLTEDAMKLLENGRYDVYHEEKEVFNREAEGYECLARVRGSSVLGSENDAKDAILGEYIKDGAVPETGTSIFDLPPSQSNLNTFSGQVPSTNDGDTFDMFAEDDENPSHEPDIGNSFQSIESENVTSEQVESDYVYDESSGYYYSSALGYYYDPASGLYCSAVSGKWYAYNEQTGTYDEAGEESATGAT